jgi:hypothetical protein
MTCPVHHPDQPEQQTPVRIIAAMVNPKGDDPRDEYVILLNKNDADIDLTGWQIVDKLNKKDIINTKIISAGDTIRITLSGAGAQLSNKGGTITLLNNNGLKIDGVSYTKEDASKEGFIVEL